MMYGVHQGLHPGDGGRHPAQALKLHFTTPDAGPVRPSHAPAAPDRKYLLLTRYQGNSLMQDHLQFYIDGQWVNPVSPRSLEVINPSNEQAIARISMGSAADVDKAVAAARRAFESYSRTSREERLALLAKVLEVYQRRYGDFVQTISQEMGAPLWLSKAAQAAMGVAHLGSTIEVLKNFAFEQVQGSTAVVHEPVGVVGMITPWNWPINQIMCKVAPALAAGCTMVLKPSEVAPLNALLVAEVLHEAGVPPGVFNLVNGDGPGVGEAMSSHPDIDMMTFTGSTRAGIAVAKAAADSVKRVAQELGGKSANIVLDDANLQKAVTQGVQAVLMNSGQSCNAPTRMFVPRALHGQAVEIAQRRRSSDRGRCAGRGHAHGPRGQRGAVGQDPGPDPQGHRRGRDPGGRRHRPPRGAGPGLLCQAHGVCRREQRHDHCARGNLRSRAGDDSLR
jgi:hypothetical protein